MDHRRAPPVSWNWILGVTSIVIFFGNFSCGAPSWKPYETDGTLSLRFVSQFSRPSILGASSRFFEEELQQRFGKRLSLRSHYGGSLVGPEETLTAIGHGVADAGTGLWIYSPGRLPLGAFEYHFLFNDPDIFVQASIKRRLFELIPALTDELVAENIGPPLVFGSLSPYLLLSRGPITDLKDLKGKRIGFTPVEYVPLFSSVGAVPILSPSSEFYERLSLGVVDAVAISVEVLYFYQLHKLAPYLLDLALNTPTPLSVWINLDYWNGLTQGDQELFVAAGYAAEKRYLDVLQLEIEKARRGFVEEGVKINKLSEESVREWRKMVPPVAETWAKAMDNRGLPGTELFRTYTALSHTGAEKFNSR